LNYGEAQSAESRKDFIQKMKVILKELRETFVCPKIIHLSKSYKTENKIIRAKKESNELISIYAKSIETAKKNLQSQLNLKSFIGVRYSEQANKKLNISR